MKIIHTGDWHIGKIVNEFSMIEDQKFYLDRLIELLEERTRCFYNSRGYI